MSAHYPIALVMIPFKLNWFIFNWVAFFSFLALFRRGGEWRVAVFFSLSCGRPWQYKVIPKGHSRLNGCTGTIFYCFFFVFFLSVVFCLFVFSGWLVVLCWSSPMAPFDWLFFLFLFFFLKNNSIGFQSWLCASVSDDIYYETIFININKSLLFLLNIINIFFFVVVRFLFSPHFRH